MGFKSVKDATDLWYKLKKKHTWSHTSSENTISRVSTVIFTAVSHTYRTLMRWALDLKVSLAFVLLAMKSFHLLFAIDTSSGRGQLGKFSNDVSMETRQRVTCVLSLNTGKSLLLSFAETWNDVKTYPNQGDVYLLFPSLVNYRMYLM